MRVFFDYPLATEENMKAVQDAINSGKDYEELDEMFGSETLWDCIAVLSGNRDTVWSVFDYMSGNDQTEIEDWQSNLIEKYINERM